MDNNQKVFFELLRAGLWGDQRPVQEFKSLIVQDSVNWEKVYQLAQEQSVQGVVLSGLEELRAKGKELSVPKVLLLQWIGEVQMIEQRNKEMNAFVVELTENLRKQDIYTLLVKGQGIAQCYERPLWRPSGDIDLLLNGENYTKASAYLPAKADQVKENRMDIKHFEMSFGSWVVELHGTLHGEWSQRADRVVDDILEKTFNNKQFRVWNNNGTEILLPAPDNDVVFVFSHILQHFFWEGIGLRQLCDWCRLLWTYKESLDIRLLEQRLKSMGVMTEWKAFAALAVDYLGIPQEAMPFYESATKYTRKAHRIISQVLESGSFGHNKDNSYKNKHSFVIRLFISFWRHIKDLYKQFRIFPLDTMKAAARMIRQGVAFAIKGE